MVNPQKALLHNAPRGMSREEEVRLFRLLDAKKRLIESLPAGRAAATHCRDYRRIRNQIVEAHLPLAVSMARRSRTNNLSMDEKVSIGLERLVAAAEKFDVERGYRFSTYACTAIVREISKQGESQTRKWDRRYEDQDVQNTEAPAPKSDEQIDTAAIMSAAGLDDLEAFTIRMHYGLGEAKQKSLTEIGRIVGLSRARIGQVREDALTKLRDAVKNPEDWLANSL